MLLPESSIGAAHQERTGWGAGEDEAQATNF